MQKQTLYYKDTKGKDRQWSIWVDDHDNICFIVSESGQVGMLFWFQINKN